MYTKWRYDIDHDGLQIRVSVEAILPERLEVDIGLFHVLSLLVSLAHHRETLPLGAHHLVVTVTNSLLLLLCEDAKRCL